MKFNMTMQIPNAWIVGPEAYDSKGIVLDHECISDSWHWAVVAVCALEGTGVWERAFQHMELVTVQVPGVEVGVAVADDDFDDVVVAHYYGIDLSVDEGVGDVFCGESVAE